jgi:aminoglycoside phosphotransferase (APT) family kinase protein
MDLPLLPGGRRLAWDHLPAVVRQALEARLGSPVVHAATQPGGFSPGLAARLRLADGRRVFVKAAGPDPNPETPALHRAEAQITAALPAIAPSPRLLWAYDQGGWVALAFEDIQGRLPTLPWQPGELQRVLEVVAELAATLTPAPVAAPSVATRLGEAFSGWRRLAAPAEHGHDNLTGLDPWARRHLDRLVALEQTWPAAAAGGTLLHLDLRADNLLLTPTRVAVVDWPWAGIGAAWVDLLLLLPSVRAHGGPQPEPLFGGHAVARGVDPDAVTAVLAAFAGYLLRESRQPPPPGLPTLRAFQQDHSRPALTWLRQRTGWP